MKTTLACVLAVVSVSLVFAEEPPTKTIQAPEGPVAVKSKTVEATPQQVQPASAEDVAAFKKEAARADEFIREYLPGDNPTDLKNLDYAFRLWQSDKKSRYSADDVIDILGSYLGSKVVEDFGMEWVVVQDEQGTDFAVRSKKVEVMAFPFATVGKRVDKEEYDFMVGVYRAIEDAQKGADHAKQ